MLDLDLSIEAVSCMGGAAPDPYPGAKVYDFQNGRYRGTTSGAYGTDPTALNGWSGTPVIGANGLTVSDAGSSVKFTCLPGATGALLAVFVVPASASNSRIIGLMAGGAGFAPLYLPDLTYDGSFLNGTALTTHVAASDVFAPGTTAKMAITWDGTTRRISANGLASFDGESTTATSWTEDMAPGSDNRTGAFLGSAISRIIVYPDFKSAAALRALTT